VKTTRQVCITIPESQIALIDRMARAVGMTRSAFIAAGAIELARGLEATRIERATRALDGTFPVT
jgi:uncharacterized protein (DUF1778 family)